MTTFESQNNMQKDKKTQHPKLHTLQISFLRCLQQSKIQNDITGEKEKKKPGISKTDDQIILLQI